MWQPQELLSKDKIRNTVSYDFDILNAIVEIRISFIFIFLIFVTNKIIYL